jgi:hypothetical protein
MRFHAVCTKPSVRSVILAASLVFMPFVALQSAYAETLGMITAINRAKGEIAINGQAYRMGSGSEVKSATGEGSYEVATWYSLKVGEYVVFDVAGDRIKSLRREAVDGLDLPAGGPVIQRAAPAGR